jgi:hypothetical protein
MITNLKAESGGKPMDRRKSLAQSAWSTFFLVGPWASWCNAQMVDIEKGAPNPEPVPEPHFPDRLHLFVWRNWELANTDRMAQILAQPSQVRTFLREN